MDERGQWQLGDHLAWGKIPSGSLEIRWMIRRQAEWQAMGNIPARDWPAITEGIEVELVIREETLSRLTSIASRATIEVEVAGR
jgi:hypothetical protein